ncbi:uncharacterized protein [Osmerus mordax]|uniref:uncharacterized protein isoform X1 n=1 Tax=Osmerus mordax TaxID=8014 RepID=UPI00350FB618
MYNIVEFTEEGLVGIVAQSWTFTDNGETYSYRPPAHPTKRARHNEMPDTALWISRKVWVFATTGDFEKALRWSKTAEYQSTVETEDEAPQKRVVKRPHKYVDSSGDEEQPWVMEKRQKKIKGPVPNVHAMVGNQKTHKDYPTTVTRPGDVSLLNNDAIHPGVVEENPLEAQENSWQPAVPSWEKTFQKIQDTLQVILQKMETLEENQREALLFRRSQGGQDRTVLDIQVSQTLAELQDLEERLTVLEFRKRVIHHLSLVSGSSPGECVRRVMRALATNAVWSSYSLRGKKGKLPLLGTALSTTIKHESNHSFLKRIYVISHVP